MKRRILSMLLVLTMLLSLVPTAVFAVEGDEPEALNYVSLGDSMTNGYGFEGYEQGSYKTEKYDFMGDVGVFVCPAVRGLFDWPRL